MPTPHGSICTIVQVGDAALGECLDVPRVGLGEGVDDLDLLGEHLRAPLGQLVGRHDGLLVEVDDDVPRRGRRAVEDDRTRPAGDGLSGTHLRLVGLVEEQRAEARPVTGDAVLLDERRREGDLAGREGVEEGGMHAEKVPRGQPVPQEEVR